MKYILMLFCWSLITGCYGYVEPTEERVIVERPVYVEHRHPKRYKYDHYNRRECHRRCDRRYRWDSWKQEKKCHRRCNRRY